jgi:hypothetical protein
LKDIKLHPSLIEEYNKMRNKAISDPTTTSLSASALQQQANFE